MHIYIYIGSSYASPPYSSFLVWNSSLNNDFQIQPFSAVVLISSLFMAGYYSVCTTLFSSSFLC